MHYIEKELQMVKRIDKWEAADGSLHDTQGKAEMHEECQMKKELVSGAGIPDMWVNTVMWIVQVYTKGWK